MLAGEAYAVACAPGGAWHDADKRGRPPRTPCACRDGRGPRSDADRAGLGLRGDPRPRRRRQPQAPDDDPEQPRRRVRPHGARGGGGDRGRRPHRPLRDHQRDRRERHGRDAARDQRERCRRPDAHDGSGRGGRGLHQPVGRDRRQGDAARTPGPVVAEVDADELVVGIRHRTAVGKAITGGVVQRLLLDSPVPVFAVKRDGRADSAV